MYRIAVCEDEIIHREQIEKECRQILSLLKIEYSLNVFENCQTLMEVISENIIDFDLLLLDIVMDGTNGMELAKMIRKTNEKVSIIFITANPEFALQGYDVKAMHYLLKPVSKDILKELIKKDYKVKYEKRYIIIENGILKQKICTDDILYMEIKGRKVELTQKEGRSLYRGQLSLLLQQLPVEQFFQCHQSFAVNIKYIKEITQNELFAVDGRGIPISRRYKKIVFEAFMKNLREV